ncbi:Protein ASP-8, partial [Aphelenchoides avenae]
VGSTSFNVAFIFIPDTWGNLDFYWPSDSILGLKRAYDITDPRDEYAIYGILSALPRNVATVYFDSKETSNAELNGQLTLGGVDTQNCNRTWDYVPAVPKTFGWSVYVTQFSYGDKLRVKQRVLATLESTTALITAPPTIVDSIVEKTGAEYDFSSDSFIVPCVKVGTFPDMVFQMGAFEYRLPDKDYIRQLPHNRHGQCTLMLDGGNYVEDQWTLGSTFGRSYCTLFDYDKNRVGFAKVLR